MLQHLEHIGHLREGGEHGAAIVLKRRLIGIDRRPAIEPARTALEYRRLHRGLPAPEPVFVLAQIAAVLRGRTVVPAQRDGWEQRCGCHADVGAGLMQTSFRREYVRPLPHQVRWQADRQGGRQPQVFQAQLRHARFAGRLAEQAVQQVIGLIALELQRRQQREIRGARAAQTEQLAVNPGTGTDARLHQVQLLRLQGDQVMHGHDFIRIRLAGQCGVHHVAGQGEIGALHHVALSIRSSVQTFHGTAFAAEQVERVADRRAQREQVEDAADAAPRLCGRRNTLACRIKAGAQLRKENTLPRAQIVLRLLQAGLGGAQIGIAGNSLRYQRIDCRRMQRTPPACADVGALAEVLRLRDGGHVLGKIVARQIAGVGRNSGALEIGTGRARGKQRYEHH